MKFFKDKFSTVMGITGTGWAWISISVFWILFLVVIGMTI